MTLNPQVHSGETTKFLELLDSDLPGCSETFYFMLCGRRYLGEQAIRILLFDSLVSDSQKINSKMIWAVPRHTVKKQWTIILSFSEENWMKLVKTTQEKEVMFECLFRNYGEDPKFAPVFGFPRLDDNKQTYDIVPKDFEGYARIGFSRGGIRINKKGDGHTVLLIRLEELGFYEAASYIVGDV